MKKLSALFFAITILQSTFLLAQNGAHVKMKIYSEGKATINGSLDLYFSEIGSRSEMKMKVPQMPGGEINIITIAKKEDESKVYLINEATKSYSEQLTTNKEDNNSYTVKVVGQEVVNGYSCMHSIVKDEDGTTEIWTSKDFADFEYYQKILNSNPKTGSQKREVALKKAGVDGFPVKTIANKHNENITIELVNYEKKAIPASLFSIPEGYTKSTNSMVPGTMNPNDIKNMSPEERAKFIEQMQKQYGGKSN